MAGERSRTPTELLRKRSKGNASSRTPTDLLREKKISLTAPWDVTPPQERKPTGGIFRTLWRKLNEPQVVDTQIAPPAEEPITYTGWPASDVYEGQTFNRNAQLYDREQAQMSPDLKKTVNGMSFEERVEYELQRMREEHPDFESVQANPFGVLGYRESRGRVSPVRRLLGRKNYSDGRIYLVVDPATGNPKEIVFPNGQAPSIEAYILEIFNVTEHIKKVHYGIHAVGRPLSQAQIETIAQEYVSNVLSEGQIISDDELMEHLKKLASAVQVHKATPGLDGSAIQQALIQKPLREGSAGHFDSHMPAAIGAEVCIPRMNQAIAILEQNPRDPQAFYDLREGLTMLSSGPGTLYRDGELDAYVSWVKYISNIQGDGSSYGFSTLEDRSNSAQKSEATDYLPSDFQSHFRS